MPYHPLPRFDSPNKIRVGDWGTIHCRLYTKDNLLYYNHVGKDKVTIKFKTEDNRHSFRVTKRWYGQFFV